MTPSERAELALFGKSRGTHMGDEERDLYAVSKATLVRAIQAAEQSVTTAQEVMVTEFPLDAGLHNLAFPETAQAHANPPAIKAAIEGVTVDPGDGCTVIPLEYVLIRGFSAMGWKLPATAAGDMLEAVAAAVAKEAIRHISPVSSTERVSK